MSMKMVNFGIRRRKKRVKTVVAVHVFGNMADMEKICDIAATYGLKVVEDATEAIGTYYTAGRFQGRFAGTIGDVVFFLLMEIRL